MVDAKVAQAIAEGRVPAGITTTYLDQTRDQPARIAIIIITTLVTIFLALRCFTRVFLVKSFGLDDGLALFSYACFITFVALCLILIEQGSGRHIQYIQYVLTQSETNSTEVNDFAAHLIYTSALFICRLSGLAFFHRLCSRHQPLLTAIRAAALFLVCAFLPQLLLILLHCTPITGLWPYAWQPEAADYKCVTWGTVYVTNSGLSLVCDFVVFSIPVAMIWLLKLSRGRKIMLAFVLMPGIVVIGISVARLYLCVVGQWAADGSWYYDPQLTIEVAEVGGTLMALSVPGIKPMFGICYGKMKSTAGSTMRRSHNPDLERDGFDRKMSEGRISSWLDGDGDMNIVRTSVNAERSTIQGSTRGEDDEFHDPRHIVVQMEVDQHSSLSMEAVRCAT